MIRPYVSAVKREMESDIKQRSANDFRDRAKRRGSRHGQTDLSKAKHYAQPVRHQNISIPRWI